MPLTRGQLDAEHASGPDEEQNGSQMEIVEAKVGVEELRSLDPATTVTENTPIRVALENRWLSRGADKVSDGHIEYLLWLRKDRTAVDLEVTG